MKNYSMFIANGAPDEIKNVTYHLAKRLAELDYKLRVSDPTTSADAIKGVKEAKGSGEIVKTATVDNWSELEQAHPTWHLCSAAARAWHAKRANAMAGSEFVVVWTPDGEEKPSETTLKTGGIGQAIRLAALRGLPVINLSKPDALTRIGAIVTK